MLGEGIELLDALVRGVDAHSAFTCAAATTRASWMSEGGYDADLRGRLQGAHGYDIFLLEYDDHRSGASPRCATSRTTRSSPSAS